jgi:hypothetical protein
MEGILENTCFNSRSWAHKGDWMRIIVGCCLVSCMFLGAQEVGRSSDSQLDQAIKDLRGIKPNELSEEQKDKFSEKINNAWKMILSMGKAGLERLKKENDIIVLSKERDDFFVLTSSVLIWRLGGADEASFIGKLWASADPALNYRYVFFTALDAAMTQDPKVLPMLEVCLDDKGGEAFVSQHSLELRQETIGTLGHLLTVESLEVLHRYSGETSDSGEKRFIESFVKRVLEESNLDWDGFSSLSPEKKQETVDRYSADSQNEFSGDITTKNKVSREEFLYLVVKWTKAGRLNNSKEIEMGPLIGISTASDIDMLLDLKGAIMRRVSDECLYETEKIDQLIWILGRKRYRKIFGVCDRVEEI